MPKRGHRPKSGSETELRIVGGRLRGRPIRYHGDPATRPMKDRVREAVFNLVGPRVVGTHAIDLFAGTGALALEAISRGARSGTMVERHGPTMRLIKRNLSELALEDQVNCLLGDAFFWGNRIAQGSAGEFPATPWLVFCSPPYQLYVDQLDEMESMLRTLHGVAPIGSLLVVESDKRYAAAGLPDARWQERTYSPAVVRIGEKQSPNP